MHFGFLGLYGHRVPRTPPSSAGASASFSIIGERWRPEGEELASEQGVLLGSRLCGDHHHRAIGQAWVFSEEAPRVDPESFGQAWV